MEVLYKIGSSPPGSNFYLILLGLMFFIMSIAIILNKNTPRAFAVLWSVFTVMWISGNIGNYLTHTHIYNTFLKNHPDFQIIEGVVKKVALSDSPRGAEIIIDDTSYYQWSRSNHCIPSGWYYKNIKVGQTVKITYKPEFGQFELPFKQNLNCTVKVEVQHNKSSNTDAASRTGS